MSAEKQTGCLAIPITGEMRDGEFVIDEALTLRDYFAAKAMQGMLACPMQPQSGADMFARDAYAVADAMLKAREV